MTKEQLIEIFNQAKEDGKDIAVEVTIPGQNTSEVIINRHENIDNKLEYYKETYNENCEHIRNNEVKIIAAYAIKYFI